MKKVLFLILAIAILLSTETSVFADNTDKSVQNGKITVGISADFPPFEYYNEAGELCGFDIDLMNYIGERTGIDIEFVNMSFDHLFSAVINGDVDCSISAITKTEERDKVVDFSEFYIETYDELGDNAKYAIIFPNFSYEKQKILDAATYESEPVLCVRVNNAIKELKEDFTIDKLIKKYNLPTVKEDEFSKTPLQASEWAIKYIDNAIAVGITNNDKDYNYIDNITREDFCEMIYNLVNLIRPDIKYSVSDSFSDTKNEKILKLNSLGIINGKTETKFAPKDYLTREEAATIIVRMVNKVTPMESTMMWFEYDDMKDISDWASDSIQTISNLGFMNGVGNNSFAPKETYTTEQAITTLMRVYDMTKPQKENSAIGIIGGADGPTSVTIGENTTIIKDENYNKFYSEITNKTTKVDDFYIDEAIKLITETSKLAVNRDFISLYTTNDEMTNKLLDLGAVDFNKPTDIFYLYADKEQMITSIKALAGEDAENINFEQLEMLTKRYNFSTLANLINASYGVENLAVLTILTNSKGYIMPKDFKNNFALFLQYEGDYSAIVSFSKFGDGVISANMAFVKNGDKDNIFKRLYEIISTIGADGFIITKAE